MVLIHSSLSVVANALLEQPQIIPRSWLSIWAGSTKSSRYRFKEDRFLAMKLRCPNLMKPFLCVQLPRRNLPRSFSQGEDALDLLNVIEVVTGEHPHDVLHRLFAALGVDSMVLPLFWGE